MNKEYFDYVDYTLLDPVAPMDKYIELAKKAIKHDCFSIMVPPSKVSFVRENFDNLIIGTVIGFPLGFTTLNAKIQETKEAIINGANEIDLVINLSNIKEKKWDSIKHEIDTIKSLIDDRILKVIIETSYINLEDLEELIEVLNNTNCDIIKTSTGFRSKGAEKDKTKLLVAKAKNKGIKASGGIRTFEDFEYFVNIGCSRIGVSNIDYLID